MKRLPTLEQLENSIQAENKSISDHQKIAKELEPLINFIDFSQIKGQILADIIDPLEIIPTKIILNVYRQKARSNNTDSNGIRGIPRTMHKFNESDYVWDESARGSKIIIEDNGKVAKSNSWSWNSVRTKMVIEDKGIFEWDFITEEGVSFWVGVCASENFNYEEWAEDQPTGWVLGNDGSFSNLNKRTYN